MRNTYPRWKPIRTTKPSDDLVELFFDDVAEPVLARPLGNDQYELAETPLLSDLAAFGDTVEATPDADGDLLVRRLVSRSGLRRFDFALPREVVGSQGLADFCEAVMQEAGNWERVAGGLLFVHLPPESSLDPQEEIRSLVEIARLSRSKH